jgi:putative FmdB family regulatory protein
MPVYEYRCQQCGEAFSHLFRTLKAAEEGKPPPCPACGADGTERLISSVAVLGGAEGGSGGEAEGAAAESTKKELFGRKELKQALDKRGY